MLSRSSGVLLHPTSLPGGRLGAEAFGFVDWLVAAGQSWWQILPLGPPDEEGSPYRAESAFACWDGLLADPDAPVSAREVDDFAGRHPYWAAEWADLAGQVRFEREWNKLRAYASARGVRIIGDLPIYVAPDSVDHETHPELFHEDAVAGVPPDAWSATGQLWGNPLYDWRALRETGYRWWIERFRRTFELVDAARIDHFRGFVAYWAVPVGHKTALAGHWRRGPGRALFDTVHAELGELPLIAEDLGVITPAVDRLRDELRLPGMAVLQFLLGGRGDPLAMPERRVAYSGTHDNDTAVGWWAEQDERVRARAHRAGVAAAVDTDDPAWLLVGLAFASPAHIAIAPAQDLLSLGSEGRMNTPGRSAGNWSWRLEPGQLDDALAARLGRLTAQTGRQRSS
jgi:4-alpha-glucanotransferase